KRAYCLKTQPATGETYPKSDLFNKAVLRSKNTVSTPLHIYALFATSMTLLSTNKANWLNIFTT
ncbi:hypothetical protein, partial [Klebsiella pneumoniae]|uniref:hypothetical protein n=1 Tax=Klebsiella pneumoniae TaxID=573 RepID=UPI003CFC1E34